MNTRVEHESEHEDENEDENENENINETGRLERDDPWDQDVGLLDIDICGPSAPIMFAQEGQDVHRSNSGKGGGVESAPVI